MADTRVLDEVLERATAGQSMAYGFTHYRGDVVLLDGMLRAVIALHRPAHGYCMPCDEDRDIEVDGNNPDCPHQFSFCSECKHRWPCATVTAATGC